MNDTSSSALQSHDAVIIDGKAYAARLRASLADKVTTLKQQTGKVPGLAVILVGEDPASQVYVRNKGKQTREVGMQSFEYTLPADTSESTLLARIEELNHNPDVHGILVQLPLPAHISEQAVIQAIAPEKDADGFHVVNVGRSATGQTATIPCTPLGCMMLLHNQLGQDLSGLHAVVIGRSNIVGKPMARLLLDANCTVTTIHSRTRDIASHCKQADIIVAAVGIPHFVKAEWIKPGATLIDVGINRIDTEDGKTQLVGDIDFNAAKSIASAITPVPGGVGPMTIACLLHNTVENFENYLHKSK